MSNYNKRLVIIYSGNVECVFLTFVFFNPLLPPTHSPLVCNENISDLNTVTCRYINFKSKEYKRY